ncbi:hypothetical protein C8J56DRAFT_798930 [Mycena floridula]|nr:hypothetical protein C8J56DRAFT_798930 [Mycena floridula]
MPSDIQKRNFFGVGEIMGVLANPAETVRSLTESRRLLEEARQEINDHRERSQIRPKHTFARLPGFFPRPPEATALKQILEGDPALTVLFGAPSVGKTALLREVLCDERYHVLHFDLRIAGFADLGSLYMSLGEQMEQYFDYIAKEMKGYKEFEKEAWSFKHDRLMVERRLSERSGSVTTSDIARLMELFQSSLLKYREFQPEVEKEHSDSSSSKTHVETPKSRWRLHRKQHTKEATNEESEVPLKRMPVILFDEAHKLPTLLRSREAMKCLLDSMLVLTKQDRLCHCLHATSDPFYQTWLMQLNVMQHCKIITVNDCSKAATLVFFQQMMLPAVPERLQPGLDFEKLYEAFGGKLAHWQDYISDYVHTNGNLDVKQSSQFLHAYALLNLHIIHSSQSFQDEPEVVSNPDAVHPALGDAGRRIYTSAAVDSDDQYGANFSAMQLLKVLSRFTGPVEHLSYFNLCRELGVRAVDAMVRARILDLQWTEPINSCIRPISQSAFSAEGDGDMVAVADPYDWIGPKLVPITPVMRYAIQEVIQEYQEERSVSEYASLSEVDEY